MLLINFLVVLIGLAVIAAIAYYGSEQAVRDATLKWIGQIVFVGIAVIIVLYAAGAVLFGVGRMIVLGPHQIIEFGIGMVIVLVVLYLMHLFFDWVLVGKLASLAVPVNYVLDALAILAIMVIAGKAFFGGGLGLIPPDFGRTTSLLIIG